MCAAGERWQQLDPVMALEVLQVQPAAEAAVAEPPPPVVSPYAP